MNALKRACAIALLVGSLPALSYGGALAVNGDLNVQSNLTASGVITGNGSGLTNIPNASVIGLGSAATNNTGDFYASGSKVESATSSDFATNAGTASYATSAGIASYATNAGRASYATNSWIANYATNAGTASYATNAGTASYATNAGSASYAASAGIASYATNAGTAASADVAQNLTPGLSNSLYQAIYSNNFITAAGGTMTGVLILPPNGLTAGTNQLVIVGGRVGIGTSTPTEGLHVTVPARFDAGITYIPAIGDLSMGSYTNSP